ncbi:MAG TPA: shikimate kinase [Chloroflexi bacterium]|nr:MAG: hypothetical protein B6243_09535 [Anaerolineaceae bacterium 4572_5.2]HEY83768.1 shikimate kinase [Chloroflexota bacterium]
MQNTVNQNIILTGFMGTGKSSVGRALAEHLGWLFLDMDALIEKREGRSVRRIFEEAGEATFRQLESDLCRELADWRGYVIATGGGTLVNPKNLATLARHHIVCLDCEPETLWERLAFADDRPMLDSADKKTRLLNLLQARQPAYARIQHHVDATRLSIDEVVDKILRMGE